MNALFSKIAPAAATAVVALAQPAPAHSRYELVSITNHFKTTAFVQTQPTGVSDVGEIVSNRGDKKFDKQTTCDTGLAVQITVANGRAHHACVVDTTTGQQTSCSTNIKQVSWFEYNQARRTHVDVTKTCDGVETKLPPIELRGLEAKKTKVEILIGASGVVVTPNLPLTKQDQAAFRSMLNVLSAAPN